MIKPEIQRLFDRAEKLYEKGLITEEQYQDQMRNKEEILRRPSEGVFINPLYKINKDDYDNMDIDIGHDTYDQALLQQVKFFQQKNDLVVDGVIGMQTLLQLDILTNQALEFVEF